MSSTAGDSHPPPSDDQWPTFIHDVKEESGGRHSNNSSALQNSATLLQTDLLGLENETVVNGGGTAEGKANADLQISPVRSGIEENRYEMIYKLPPDLSILNVNGRSRFELVTVREDGRLRMFMVPKRWPQLVRSPLRDGRVKMWLLNDDQHGGEQPSLPPARRSI